MNNREGVMIGLECLTTRNASCNPNCPYINSDDCISLLAADALAFLRLQEPVKPRRNIKGAWRCGNCERMLNPSDVYCSYCGKKVKWDDGAD